MQREIGVDVVERAIELARYFVSHAMLAFDVMSDDETTAHMRKVLAWIRSNDQVRQDGGFTLYACTKALTGRLNRGERDEALLGLEDRGYLQSRKIKPENGKGKPVQFYKVSPHAY